MRSIKKSVMYLFGSIFATAFTGCSVDDNSLPESTPVSDVKVMASGFMKVEKTGTAGEDADESGEVKVTQMTEEEVKAEQRTHLMGDDSGSSAFYCYAWTTITYRCMTADGSQKDLSELLVWPCTYFNWEPDQLVIGCHSTITSNAECPSNFSNLPNAGEINMLALFANAFSQEALVIVPDYEGYGSTASYPHPYCNRELTAQQVVEGVKAGLAYFQKKVKSMEDDWSGVAIGYSQGGAVAAGVLRYCQEHNETSLRLKGAVCGDGPYDPLATLKRYIEMDKIYMPVAPTLLLKGAIDTDPDMMALNCKYQDFVTDKFYKTGIFDMVGKKVMTTDNIQTALLDHSRKFGDDGGFVMRAHCEDGFLPYTKSNLYNSKGKERSFDLDNGEAMNYCTVDQCFKPGVIEYFRSGAILGDVPEAKLKALEHALAKNALTAGNYKPGKGYTFFHSIGDEVVPYCNFESVRNAWGVGSIEALTYQSNTTLHVGTGRAFYLRYSGGLVDEILDNKWSPREETIGGGLWAEQQ